MRTTLWAGRVGAYVHRLAEQALTCSLAEQVVNKLFEFMRETHPGVQVRCFFFTDALLLLY